MMFAPVLPGPATARPPAFRFGKPVSNLIMPDLRLKAKHPGFLFGERSRPLVPPFKQKGLRACCPRGNPAAFCPAAHLFRTLK
jgi:hypothetical protein